MARRSPSASLPCFSVGSWNILNSITCPNDSSDPLERYRPLFRLFLAEDVDFVRAVILAHGRNPGPIIRSLRRDRWRISVLYVGELAHDLHRQYRDCGQALARAGRWGWYYRRCWLLWNAYLCLARLLWAGLRFRFGLGGPDSNAVLASVARLAAVQHSLAALA
jgi:hypothetical protein